MKRYDANTQLKLLFYVAAIAFGIYYVGTKFNLIEFSEILEIKKEEKQQEEVEVIDKESDNVVVKTVNKAGQKIELDLEVADSDSEKSQGLMYRKSIGEYQGMIFVYSAQVSNTFWMKNTLIPLDMIFLSSDGEVVSIQREAQPCIQDPCTHYPSSAPYRYTIEVNGGWSKKNNIDIGTEFDLSEITSET